MLDEKKKSDPLVRSDWGFFSKLSTVKSETLTESCRPKVKTELCNYSVTRIGAIKEMYISARFTVADAR